MMEKSNYLTSLGSKSGSEATVVMYWALDSRSGFFSSMDGLRRDMASIRVWTTKCKKIMTIDQSW